MIRRWLIGASISGATAGAGYRAGALTGRAAVAASGVGTAILRPGWRGGVVLAAFFVSGSVLPRLFRSSRRFKSDSARTERQVLANGGVAALLGLSTPVIGADRALVGIAGSLAAATADTWATEIGSTSKSPPRLVLSRQPVAPGMSGGVTPRGSIAAIGGALTIGVLAAMLRSDARLMLPVAVAGAGGSLIDSVLGEFVQGRYLQPDTGDIVETPEPQRPAWLVGGHPRVDNDVVNLACTLAGAGVALVMHETVSRRTRGRHERFLSD